MRLDPLKRNGQIYSRVGSAIAKSPKAIAGGGHRYGSNSRLGTLIGKNTGYDNLGSPATSEAIRPMPRTANMAVQVRKPITLSATTPPMPRGKASASSNSPKRGIVSKMRAAVAANKGTNQAKAKARMLAASRK